MHKYAYLLVLVSLLAVVLFFDRKDFKESMKIVGISVMFCLVWDVAGINLGIFHTNQEWVSGLHLISRDLPVEEVLFLTFLSYFTVIVWRQVK